MKKLNKKNSRDVIALFLALFTLCLPACGTLSKAKLMNPSEPVRGECVILMHGLGRTYRSMSKMQERLSEAGYWTINLDYPSRKKSIRELAAEYVPPALDQCYSVHPEKIHFVTHSMGGIVLRMAIKQNRPEKLGRVVMLSPPNGGSEAVDAIKDRWYYSWINGPAGQELSTFMDSVPNQLGPVDYSVGIITGNKQAFFDSWLLAFFHGLNDGKVSVERAKVHGMIDFLIVPESHSFIMKSQGVQNQTIRFLQQERFLHDD